MVNVDELLSNTEVFHINDHLINCVDALRFIIKNKHKNISFNHIIDFEIDDLEVLEFNSKLEKYTYTYFFDRTVDIITDIESDVPIKFISGHTVVDTNELVIVNCLCDRQVNAIRFYVEPSFRATSFYLKAKHYILDPDITKTMRRHGAYTKNLKYHHGYLWDYSNSPR